MEEKEKTPKIKPAPIGVGVKPFVVCPNCRSSAVKVLYAGLPMNLCTNEQCSLTWGFWSFIMEWIPFNGMFLVYEGGYVPALWRWLTEPIRQHFCSHAIYLEDLVRINEERVECPCNRCGKLLIAEYGLALNAKFERRPKP